MYKLVWCYTLWIAYCMLCYLLWLQAEQLSHLQSKLDELLTWVNCLPVPSLWWTVLCFLFFVYIYEHFNLTYLYFNKLSLADIICVCAYVCFCVASSLNPATAPTSRHQILTLWSSGRQTRRYRRRLCLTLEDDCSLMLWSRRLMWPQRWKSSSVCYLTIILYCVPVYNNNMS